MRRHAILRLRFYEGLSQREIAERTGTPLGTVKMRMVQALDRLRLMLDEEGRAVSDENWLTDHLLGEETESEAAEARRRLDADPALRARAARLAEVAATLQELSPAAWEVASGPQPTAPARMGAPARRSAGGCGSPRR